jgi:hypothetical protein
MAENVGSESGEGGITLVATVPEEQAQAVIDFMKSLDTEAADVTGYMISQGGGLLGAGGLGLTQTTCSDPSRGTPTGKGHTDSTCGDTDKLTSLTGA